MPDIFVSTPAEKSSNPAVGADKAAVAPPQSQEMGPAGKSLPFLAAFCENPLGIRFRDQDPDETVKLFLRRHLITNIPWVVITVLLLFVPLLIPPLLSTFAIRLTAVPQSIIVVLLLFYYIIVFGYGLVNFVTWFYNIGIVTDKKVLDADFSNVMYKNISVTSIQDLADVDYTQQGFLQTFFNFGDVFMQTEAIKQNFEFEKVPQPARITHILLDLIERQPHG